MEFKATAALLVIAAMMSPLAGKATAASPPPRLL